ncbi:MAG: hypothetical protein M3Q42_02850 [Pseudomonadota bacterium]|nr:hypothetical protein [Pseudomonadota bacterium]
MTEIRKVSPSAGAEWLLGGFALLRKAPLALGLLGLIWGGLSTLASMTGQLWLSFALALLGPILFGGLLYAVREVDQDRAARPSHLAQGLQAGKALRLLAMLLPQLVAVVIVVAMLFAMIGAEQLQELARVMEQMQTNPDPQLAEALPAGRMFAWLLIALAVGILAGLFTFVAIPEVMFTDRGALDAMVLSFRTCLRNIGALAVMLVLTLIAMIAISLAVQLVIALLGLVIGMQPAMFAGQLLLTAVVLPVMAGAVYHAWRQMLDGGESVRAPAPPVHNGGFEA